MKQKDYDAALESFEKSIKINPEDKDLETIFKKVLRKNR